MSTYAYEPYWPDPAKELETCLNFYRKLVTQLPTWDLMEFVAYLSYRDGIAWALEQLGRENVEPTILAEIESLDAQLRANARYLVDELELYKHIRRDEPEEYWWWYLDGGKPDRGPQVAAGQMWTPAEPMPAATVAEKRASYRAQSNNESETR